MVVSSETPRQSFTTLVPDAADLSLCTFLSRSLITCSSWLPDGVFDPVAAFFELVAFVDEQRDVAAVIDDELRALAVRERDRASSVQSQYSSSVSPFQANTGTPAAAIAAAA